MSKHSIEKDFLGIDIFSRSERISIQLSWSWIRGRKRRWFCRIFDYGDSYLTPTEWGWAYGRNKFEAYRAALKNVKCRFKIDK